MRRHPDARARRRGFTLAEILIAGSIAAAMAGAAILFVVQGTRASLRTAASSENDLVQWSISSRLQLDSRVANGAVIFTDTNTANITVAKRRVGGQRGNLLVLSRSRNADGSRSSSFQNLTGYYYAPDSRQLFKFDHPVSAAQQASQATLETILTTNLATITFVRIGENIDTIDDDGLFVSRDIGNINAAAATLRLNQGNTRLGTADTALVEVSFMIRN